MSLQPKIAEQIKTAMKAKDQTALDALRAIKSAILLAQTESGGKTELDEATETKLLQKLVKQRRDSTELYEKQGREDLAAPERAQAEIIQQFLPKPLEEEEIAQIVDALISETGASGMKDMGKIMGMATKKLAGKADGKTVADIVKQKLASL